jgi:hypothetical protein
MTTPALRGSRLADEGRDGATELVGEMTERLERWLVLVVEPLRQRSGRNLEFPGDLSLAVIGEPLVDHALESVACGHPLSFAYPERSVKHIIRISRTPAELR